MARIVYEFRFYQPEIPIYSRLIHLPHFIRARNIIPRKQSSMHIAIHTPCSPMEGASKAASVRRTAQILTKFIVAGTNVSPAPINTP
ncbi:unknown [Bacteroides sp. CAG:144]|nr:unknown [Bacteroides sp. CAG:144]